VQASMHTSSVAEETASFKRKMLTTPRQAKRTQRTVRVEKNRPVEVKHHSSPTVLTVGHSTRPLAEFIALLSGHSVSRLVDVRTVPRSRHNPQFNRDSLPAALEDARIPLYACSRTRRLSPYSPGVFAHGLAE